MASTCSSVRAFVILLISVIILFELVTGQPVDPYFSGPGAATENRGSPASPLPSTTGRCDTSYFALFSFPGNRASFNKREDAAAHVHRIYARALESEHQGLSSREKLIIGLGAGIGGLCVLLSILVIARYQKSWYRAIPLRFTRKGTRRNLRSPPPENTFRRHHESMRSIGTPKTNLQVFYGPEGTLYQTCPYHPGLPSLLTSYYQPVEVYRTLMRSTKQPRHPPSPVSQPALSPATQAAQHDSSPQHVQYLSEPPSPSDSAISPRTIPPRPRRAIYAPQPQCAGLSNNMRQSVGMGVCHPPPAKLRPLPLREYSGVNPPRYGFPT
uniref:Uncharacterized protein n=1 Tax=Coccidioides posadasii RMSCC 3488 TaxID=454284 RepID=A0A0J6FDX9_COCPO|nr:hypothetical protein CPAG_04835 [Coccidioides posadasii RMSCC 3488]